jgi:hypothetical protein
MSVNSLLAAVGCVAVFGVSGIALCVVTHPVVRRRGQVPSGRLLPPAGDERPTLVFDLPDEVPTVTFPKEITLAAPVVPCCPPADSAEVVLRPVPAPPISYAAYPPPPPVPVTAPACPAGRTAFHPTPLFFAVLAAFFGTEAA